LNSVTPSGLCDPKIRAALQAVVKDPQTANWYMIDDDVRPIIVLISQIISGAQGISA
jgi:hypothetical protein